MKRKNDASPSTNSDHTSDSNKLSKSDHNPPPNFSTANSIDPSNPRGTKIIDTPSYLDNDPEFDMFSDDIPEITSKQLISTNLDKREYLDNWNDSEGYLIFSPGEILANRYKTVGVLGKGVYSNVFQGEDMEHNDFVAIKILRNNDVMKKSGQSEVSHLKRLAESDPENNHFILRMRSSFEHKCHLCIVVDHEAMNFRQVLEKFGRDEGKQVGLDLTAVRIYSYQLLMGLDLLKKCSLIHSDIKPENILINSKKNRLKLSDFGSVIGRSDVVNMRTPLIQSRYYRAPEIALGMEFDYQIDLWSVACTIYELFTGKILFPSESNNHMLFLHMSLRGPVSAKVLKKSLFRESHFDVNNDFLLEEIDSVTGKIFSKKVPIPRNSLKELLYDEKSDEKDLIVLLIDFLEKCLIIDPSKRITVENALKHPFISK